MATFTNIATLSYNGNTTNSNIVTGEITDVLSITKTPVLDNYTNGDNITYVISIVNSGTIPYRAVLVNDNLGEYTYNTQVVYPLEYIDGSIKYYINGVLQPQPVVSSTQPLVIESIDVMPGGNTTIVYDTVVNQFAPLAPDASITNTVDVENADGTILASTSSTIYTLSEPILAISKAISPSVVTESGRLTYTFTIQNTGNVPAVATDNVVLTDTFNPVLSQLSVMLNSTVLTEGSDYNYNQVTGLFSTNSGVITVPAATYIQNPDGSFSVVPGVTTLTVTGTV